MEMRRTSYMAQPTFQLSRKRPAQLEVDRIVIYKKG